MRRIPSWRLIVSEKRGVNVLGEDMHNPGFWSRVCLHNIAKLAKEATTVRRVLESLFRYFDNGNLWSPKHELALSVLMNNAVDPFLRLVDDSMLQAVESSPDQPRKVCG
ncbi:hypothetical protein RchiOBHm_Chr1g0316751 [Rosa chinensis]|uniref:Uncharacterized protein n=1 Tax=Rosa chinensis TaxID=74649 RepID=A0A2P6S7T0_ROSCH|nr:hypothetical protein RchiOBHm_Chr1g0316751 [Rosa chinensis]